MAALHNRLHDFLNALDDAELVDDAWESTLAYMRDLGANHIGIQSYSKGSDPVRRWSTPPWVAEMYRETVYPSHDPKLEHCREKMTPYFYEKEFWEREPDLPGPRRQLDEEIVAVGNRSAVAFPNHTVSKQSWGYFAFTADVDKAEFERLFVDRGAEIQLAGIGAFNHIRNLADKEEASSIGITKRERECLLWLGRGLRYDQIADRLGVRTVTVEFHIAKARRKLNARTREQALVKAVQLNILDP